MMSLAWTCGQQVFELNYERGEGPTRRKRIRGGGWTSDQTIYQGARSGEPLQDMKQAGRHSQLGVTHTEERRTDGGVRQRKNKGDQRELFCRCRLWNYWWHGLAQLVMHRQGEEER